MLSTMTVVTVGYRFIRAVHCAKLAKLHFNVLNMRKCAKLS